MNKKIAAALILILAVSAVSVFASKPAGAQSTPTPAAPTFTVQLVGPPTRVNTTYSLDQNTGQIVAKIGYTNEYSGLNITVKNQVFSNLGANTVYYNVRIRPDGSGNWTDLFNANDPVFLKQSTSQYTVIPLGVNNGIYTEYYVYPEVPAVKIDVQVQAMVGSIGAPPYRGGIPSWYSEFYGNTGPWSNTQIVNIPANVPLSPASTSSPTIVTPTQTPTTTAASGSSSVSFWQIVSVVSLTAVAVLLVIVVLLLKRKTRNL